MTQPVQITAIIAAGGRGERFGADRPKQLVAVAGMSILERTIRAFASHPQIDEVVVALPREIVDDPPAFLRSAEAFALQRSAEAFPLQRSAEAFALQRSTEAFALRVVEGGPRRQDSVANAFRATDPKSEVIVVHDAARPFASADLISRTISAAANAGAAVAALAARDTVKRADAAEGGRRIVRETLLRESIYLAQTPQAFRREVLRQALGLGVEATDEASLAERAGHIVQIVEGEASNIKITTADDLVIAEAIAARSAKAFALQGGEGSERDGFSRAKPARTGRAGTGYDLHRLVAGRPLVIGGVTIPSDLGALGHSDADVACHAITDAILGAAGLGDIGRMFPDSDPAWKDASSLDLLSRATALVRDRGLEVGNVDVTVVLERPKIKDYLEQMRAQVAKAIGIADDRVSIKGKTNEGLDAVGRGEAIAAHAIALVRSGGKP